MRSFDLALILLLVGCTKPPVATLSAMQSPGSLAIAIKPIPLNAQGKANLEFEATDAILASVCPGDAPKRFYYAFSNAEATESVERITLAEQSAPRITLALPDNPQQLLTNSYKTQSLGAALGDTLLFASAYRYPDFTRIHAQCAYVGEHCYVCIDTNDVDSSIASASMSLGHAFDEQIYPITTNLLGQDPPGRSDGFNGGQDRLFILVTSDIQSYSPGALGLVSIVDLLNGNFAKVLYINPDTDLSSVLPVMAHEFAHIIFNSNRLVTYSRAIGNNKQLGDDPAYYNSGAAGKEKWLNEGLAMLSTLANGYTPDSDCRFVMDHLLAYLERPEDFDITSFSKQTTDNLSGGPFDDYGGVGLFMAYMQGLDPEFPKRLQQAASVSVDAVTETVQPRDFSNVYRDYALALCLDGLSSKLPPKYQIPYVDLHKSYGGRYSFGGPNSSTCLYGSRAPRHGGIRFAKAHFPSGKGALQLGLSLSSSYQGALILMRPAESDSFTDESF